MSNTISFTGRLGQDPENKLVGETPLLLFSVASDVGYADKKHTNWFNCELWGKRASSLSSHLKTGTEVFIIGEVRIEPYEKDGVKKISTKIKVKELNFCGSKK